MSVHLFGTDGIRGRVGQSPFTAHELFTLGHAIGQWAQDIYSHPRIFIGQDTRSSGDWVFANLSGALLMHSATISNAQVLSTPALCRILQQSDNFDFGIIISASHNPAQDNGIKIVDKKYGKITATQESAITQNYLASKAYNYNNFGSLHYYQDAEHAYIQSILPLFETKFLKNILVGLDCANGATYRVAEKVFTHFGAQVVAINTEPDGYNINHKCGAVHLEGLQKLVTQKKLTCGFAFDGDGDRVIAVNSAGEIKNGDDMLALLSRHSLYSQQKTVVSTVMSNVGLEQFLQKNNKLLIRTAVGDKYVADTLQEQKLLLGGEQSGHIILNDYLPTGDGLVTALRLCHAAQESNNWDMKTFTHYPQLLVNMPVTIKKDLKSPAIASIIKEHEKLLDSGRLLVRYSGTENLLRIMIEDRTHKSAQALGNRLKKALQNYL